MKEKLENPNSPPDAQATLNLQNSLNRDSGTRSDPSPLSFDSIISTHNLRSIGVGIRCLQINWSCLAAKLYSIGMSDAACHEPPGSCLQDSSLERPKKRQKIAIACDACRARKVKCDGFRPGGLKLVET